MDADPKMDRWERAVRLLVELMGAFFLGAILLTIIPVIIGTPRPTSAHDPDSGITFHLDSLPYALVVLAIYGAFCVWLEATANRRRSPSA